MSQKIQSKTPEQKIAKRRADMPGLYRGIYDKAMSGNSRKAAMHAFCLECMGWQRKEVEYCTSSDCPLYPYRPYANGTENNKEADSGAESKSDGPGVSRLRSG